MLVASLATSDFSASSRVVHRLNIGNAALAVASISTSDDFVQTNTCGSSVAVGASCVITVRFAPTAEGSRSGALAITDNAHRQPTRGVAAWLGDGPHEPADGFFHVPLRWADLWFRRHQFLSDQWKYHDLGMGIRRRDHCLGVDREPHVRGGRHVHSHAESDR